jgi:hypothetical protein
VSWKEVPEEEDTCMSCVIRNGVCTSCDRAVGSCLIVGQSNRWPGGDSCRGRQKNAFKVSETD